MRGGSRFHKYEENIMNANIDYLGLLTCLGLSVIAYLKIWGREKWIKSIVIGVCMVAFLYGVFVLFLHVPVPKGPLGF